MRIVTISHDPFSRTTMERMVVKPLVGSSNCAWCGNKNGKGSLFRYRWVSDAGRTGDWGRQYCSIGCLRSHTGWGE